MMENIKIILENGTEKEVNALFYLYNSSYYFIYTEKEIDENGYVILKLVQVGKEVKNTESGTVETGYMIGVAPTDWGSVQKSVTQIVEDKKNGTASPEIQYLPMTMLTKLKISSNKTIRLMKSALEQYFGVKFEEAPAEAPLSTPVEPVVSTPEPAPTPEPEPTPTPEPEPTPVVAPAPEPVIPAEEVVQPATDSEPTLAVDPVVTTEEVEKPSNVIVPNAEEVPTISTLDVSQPIDLITPDVSTDTNSSANDIFDDSNKEVIKDPEEDDDVIVDYRKSYFDEQAKNKELEAKIEELTEKINKIKELLN